MPVWGENGVAVLSPLGRSRVVAQEGVRTKETRREDDLRTTVMSMASKITRIKYQESHLVDTSNEGAVAKLEQTTVDRLLRFEGAKLDNLGNDLCVGVQTADTTASHV